MRLAFALPSRADTGNGGGADYVDGLVDGLRQIGADVSLQTGPEPAFPPGATPVVDGMLLPSLETRLDELLARDAVVLIHHIGAAAGPDPASRGRVIETERSMLARIRRLVATSEPVAARLSTECGLVARSVSPGVRDLPQAMPDPAAPLILAVGVMTRRKNHAAVLRAAARLLDLPWHLHIAGDSGRDPAGPDELTTLVEQLGLEGRVTLHRDPRPDQLEPLWQRATLFVSASRWEGYPSAVAEALARGIPVLATDTVNAGFMPADAGAICPLDDAATFGKLMRRLLFDEPLLADMAEAARVAGAALPRWPARAREFLSCLETAP